MLKITAGQVLKPVDGDATLDVARRVLSVNEIIGNALLIPIEPRRSHKRVYFARPAVFDLCTLERALNQPAPGIRIEAVRPRPITLLSDQELEEKYKRKRPAKAPTFQRRQDRYDLIKPLVEADDAFLLFDPETRKERIRARAREIAEAPEILERLCKEIRNLLDRYYAGDFTKEALVPAESTCTYRKKSSIKGSISLRHRDLYLLIAPLVEPADSARKSDDEICLRAREIAASSQTQARLCNEIRDLLNQYWAGNSCRDALTPFLAASGGKGKRKKTNGKKLGRKNRATLAASEVNEIGGSAGFICTPDHVDIIQFCWRNYYLKDKTVSKACRKMWRNFYSTLVTDDAGKITNEYLPVTERPTESQFQDWGQKQHAGNAAWRKQLNHKGYERNYRPLFGSATDDVFAVAQRGAMDSTPPDLQFVSLDSRLNRIGGGNRIIIRDTLFGYIPGFYVGLHPPCSATVKLALLHAMMDKTQWLKWLDLDCSADDWIPMHFGQILSDNTDCRTEEIHSTLNSIVSGSMHVPTYRSDLNAIAEAGHHILHRLGDHNLNGTTYGRRTERGEMAADLRACHTIIEGIRETARAIHTHNTMHLDIPLPIKMTKDGVEPSRLAMTRWAIANGRIARLPLDIDTARAKLLPVCPGTFTECGVKLHRPDSGDKKKYISRLVYVSRHPLILARLGQARRIMRGKTDLEGNFRVDPFCLNQIWYLDLENTELIPLTLKGNDFDLKNSSTFYDAMDFQDADDIAGASIADIQDRQISKMEGEQEATNEASEAAYKAEYDALEVKPSNKNLKADKQKNREAEEENLFGGMPIATLASFPDRSQDSPKFGNGEKDTFHRPPNLNLVPRKVQSPTSSPPKSVLAQAIKAHQEKQL